MYSFIAVEVRTLGKTKLFPSGSDIREGTFFIGLGRGGGGRGGPPPSWNGLMHDPSEIPKEKHLTLDPTYLKKKKTGSDYKLEVLLI